jgi:hypothetical protein
MTTISPCLQWLFDNRRSLPQALGEYAAGGASVLEGSLVFRLYESLSAADRAIGDAAYNREISRRLGL